MKAVLKDLFGHSKANYEYDDKGELKSIKGERGDYESFDLKFNNNKLISVTGYLRVYTKGEEKKMLRREAGLLNGI